EVDMAPDAIELAVRGDTGTGSYRFICPACMTLVQKRADQKIVDLLSSVGVSVATPSSPSLFEGIDDVDVPAPSGMFEMPFEPRKPSAPEGPGRSPFTYDDLITFHFLLQDDEWLAEMIGGGKAKEPGRRRRPKRG